MLHLYLARLFPCLIIIIYPKHDENDLLNEISNQLLYLGKSFSAMDESKTTCNKRYVALNIPQTIEHCRKR